MLPAVCGDGLVGAVGSKIIEGGADGAGLGGHDAPVLVKVVGLAADLLPARIRGSVGMNVEPAFPVLQPAGRGTQGAAVLEDIDLMVDLITLAVIHVIGFRLEVIPFAADGLPAV